MEAERHVTILNQKGLHVRPATLFAETAGRFSCGIEVVKDGQIVDGKSCIDLLTLAAEPGTPLLLRANGSDAEVAVSTLADLIQDRFGFKDD